MELPRALRPDQRYFNIGEASRISQVPEYTLRYWESRMRLLRPVRRESGHRRYTRRDLGVILRLKELLRDHRMTMAGARRQLARELRLGAALQEPAPSMPRTPPRGVSELGGQIAPQTLRILREVKDGLREILSELS